MAKSSHILSPVWRPHSHNYSCPRQMPYLYAGALKDKEKGKGYKFHGIRCNHLSNQVESAKNTFLTTNFTVMH